MYYQGGEKKAGVIVTEANVRVKGDPSGSVVEALWELYVRNQKGVIQAITAHTIDAVDKLLTPGLKSTRISWSLYDTHVLRFHTPILPSSW